MNKSIGRVRHRKIAASIGLLWLLSCTVSLHAAPITWNVTFNDQSGTYQAYDDAIRSTLLATANEWSTHLVTSAPRTVDIEVRFTTAVPRSSGHSVTSAFITTVNGVNVYEQGVVDKLETGQEPNGTTPDIYVDFNPTYLQNELWFDPAPASRTAPVPADKTDAYSVIVHELTHAIVFNGWRDGQTGALPTGPPPYESTFDRNEVFDGTNLYFVGPLAESLYGGPVPITYSNNWHIGNYPPRPGSNLLHDLMNGVVFYRGTRYDLSALDLAMATDSGAPTNFIPGDANADGNVGFDDLVALARNYGQTNATLAMGDFNSDGTVDFSDLVILARHYGQSAPPPVIPGVAVQVTELADAVPEPAMCVVAIAGGMFLLLSRSRPNSDLSRPPSAR